MSEMYPTSVTEHRPPRALREGPRGWGGAGVGNEAGKVTDNNHTHTYVNSRALCLALRKAIYMHCMSYHAEGTWNSAWQSKHAINVSCCH